MTDFWTVVGEQTEELRQATSAAAVLAIVSHERNPYGAGTGCGDGFFAGEGGDMWEALTSAGWRVLWSNADYHWCMSAPDSSEITYVEGDVYEGNQR